MRIGFVSSYPPIECGIGTYTQYLTDAMRQLPTEVYVVSHAGASGPNVFPAFDYEDADLAERAFRAMVRLTPDVVHIQHEFGLFGKHQGVSVVPLIIQFRQAGIPVVTTLHTVYAETPRDHREVLQAIVNHSDRLVVHSPYQHTALCETFGPFLEEKTVVIPHGVRVLEHLSDAKRRLGLPEHQKVILLIGYMRPTKNFELVVDILPEVLQRYSNATLVLAGKVRGHEHLDYRNQLLRRVADSPVRDSIHLVRGQFPQPVFDQLVSAADVVVLPYKTTSQSGILAHCLAFARPVVVGDSPAMDQTMQRCEAGVTCRNRREFIDAVVRILADDQFAAKLSRNATNYVRDEVSWPRIARRTLDLYRSLLEPPIANVHVIDADERLQTGSPSVPLAKVKAMPTPTTSCGQGDDDDASTHTIQTLRE